jgi:cell division protein FtsW (lipid II flippase)
MLVMVDALVLALWWTLQTSVHGTPPTSWWPVAVAILGASALAHLATRWLAPNANPVFLPVTLLLNGLGEVVILRWWPLTGSLAHNRAVLQAIWTGVGLVLYIGTLATVRHSRDLDRFRTISLLAAIILLLSPLIPGIGVNVNGARLWLNVGGFSIQPIEFAKILLCLFFASYFAENRELLSIPTARLGNRLFLDPRPLIPIVAVWGLTMVVIGGENDIGFALLIFSVFIALLWVTTGRAIYLGFGFGLFAAGADVATHLFPHVHARVLVWLNPWAPNLIQGSGRQLVQGWFSLAAGGVTGTGLGQGVSGRYVSDITTDMILSSIGEELGLLGAAVVVLCFLLYAGAGLRTAQRARSSFSRLAATAMTLIVVLQAFFIMAGVTRLLPLTGVELPFVAYGGSTLMANYVLTGILMRISDEERDEAPSAIAT